MAENKKPEYVLYSVYAGPKTEDLLQIYALTRKDEQGHVWPGRTAVWVSVRYSKDDACWNMEVRTDSKEDSEFFHRYGRHAWEEMCAHLIRWHKRVGGLIDYQPAEELPKGFMHPRYANMAPILETPKEMLATLSAYSKPKLTRIIERMAEKKIELRAKPTARRISHSHRPK